MDHASRGKHTAHCRHMQEYEAPCRLHLWTLTQHCAGGTGTHHWSEAPQSELARSNVWPCLPCSRCFAAAIECLLSGAPACSLLGTFACCLQSHKLPCGPRYRPHLGGCCRYAIACMAAPDDMSSWVASHRTQLNLQADKCGLSKADAEAKDTSHDRRFLSFHSPHLLALC